MGQQKIKRVEKWKRGKEDDNRIGASEERERESLEGESHLCYS